jgi:hypothetical protein
MQIPAVVVSLSYQLECALCHARPNLQQRIVVVFQALLIASFALVIARLIQVGGMASSADTK